MSSTWCNKVLEIRDAGGRGIYARIVDANGLFVFRWRINYDEEIFEQCDIPVGVIEKFDTFIRLCEYYATPADLKAWFLEKVRDYGKQPV